MPLPAGAGVRPRRRGSGRPAAGREEAPIDSQSRPPRHGRLPPGAAIVAALAAAAVSGAACGGAIASPYPAARATEPVEDDSGLAGVAIGAAAAAGGGDTQPTDGTTSGGDGGDAGDGNSALIGLRLSAAGRAVMARSPGGQVAWVAAVEEEAGGRDLISLWPRDAATAAAETAGRWPGAAPALRIWVPAAAPPEVSLTLAIDAGDPGGDSAPSWWGRLRLDARPASVGPPPPEPEVGGEFEAHGPDGTLAGRFRAVRLAR